MCFLGWNSHVRCNRQVSTQQPPHWAWIIRSPCFVERLTLSEATGIRKGYIFVSVSSRSKPLTEIIQLMSVLWMPRDRSRSYFNQGFWNPLTRSLTVHQQTKEPPEQLQFTAEMWSFQRLKSILRTRRECWIIPRVSRFLRLFTWKGDTGGKAAEVSEGEENKPARSNAISGEWRSDGGGIFFL